MKKKIAYLLALMMLLSACSEGAAKEETAGESPAESEANVEETAAENVDPRMLVDDELPIRISADGTSLFSEAEIPHSMSLFTPKASTAG